MVLDLDGSGCPLSSQAMRFHLDGRYSRLRATVALDDSVPLDTYVAVTVEADGRVLASATVSVLDPMTIDEKVESVAEIVVGAKAQSHQVGTCGQGGIAVTVTHASVD
jgi:hypothetical protein